MGDCVGTRDRGQVAATPVAASASTVRSRALAVEGFILLHADVAHTGDRGAGSLVAKGRVAELKF